jgi:hypothetical protein
MITSAEARTFEQSFVGFLPLGFRTGWSIKKQQRCRNHGPSAETILTSPANVGPYQARNLSV